MVCLTFTAMSGRERICTAATRSSRGGLVGSCPAAGKRARAARVASRAGRMAGTPPGRVRADLMEFPRFCVGLPRRGWGGYNVRGGIRGGRDMRALLLVVAVAAQAGERTEVVQGTSGSRSEGLE